MPEVRGRSCWSCVSGMREDYAAGDNGTVQLDVLCCTLIARVIISSCYCLRVSFDGASAFLSFRAICRLRQRATVLASLQLFVNVTLSLLRWAIHDLKPLHRTLFRQRRASRHRKLSCPTVRKLMTNTAATAIWPENNTLLVLLRLHMAYFDSLSKW